MIPTGYVADTVRVKQRFKYQFKYLVFDLTKTESNGAINYEIEVEIADINHLKQHLHD
jgi:hypothetical protein